MGIYDMAMQGLQIADQGRERKKQKTLAGLLSQAYQNPDQRDNALGQAMAIDPTTTLAARKDFGAMDDERKAKMVQHAQMFSSLPDEMKAQVYPQLAAEVRKITGINVPDQYDPKFLPMIQKMAGGQEAEQFTLSPGAARYDASGRQIASQPFAPANSQLANVPTGDGGSQQMLFNPRTGQFEQPNYGGMPQAPQQAPGGDLFASLPPGLQVTSGLRTPEHNRAVGGVPNSYHLTGQARDIAPPTGPQAQQVRSWAAQNGMEIINEGDHWHIEPKGNAPHQMGSGGGGRMGYTPPDAKTKDPSALVEKLQLAQQMGATPDQLKQMVLGETGGGKPSATMLRQANAAKLKLIDLKAIEDQIALVDTAFSPLKDSWSAGPYTGGLVPSENGKKFDGAVSMLQGMVRKLTRTPGEGSMSDYETKLAQLANPSRSDYESVTADKIEQLRALVGTMKQGYQAILEDNGGNSANIQNPQETNTQDSSIDALLDKYK